MMSVQTLLGDLNLDIREPAVCITLISKWVTITGTMLKKSTMVLVDQKGTTIEGTLYQELEASNQITVDEGDWFEIRNFKLVHASGLIRLSTNRYHIEMTNSSVISKIQPKIFGNYYCFSHFLNVLHVLCVLNFWQIERAEGTFKPMRNIEGFSKFLIEPEIT
ncbi:unnamed protein product [Brassica oleracea]